jgi:hypothetical protein
MGRLLIRLLRSRSAVNGSCEADSIASPSPGLRLRQLLGLSRVRAQRPMVQGQDRSVIKTFSNRF